MDASPTRELNSNIRPRVAFLPRGLLREGHSSAVITEADSVRSDFPKGTLEKETRNCLPGGQQVAENGGNERAVPIAGSRHERTALWPDLPSASENTSGILQQSDFRVPALPATGLDPVC